MAARDRQSKQTNFVGGPRTINTDDSMRQSNVAFGGRSSNSQSFSQPRGQAVAKLNMTNSAPVRDRDRGPKLQESVCIGEEVKIAVGMAVERFLSDENMKEMEFPSSFTATERAYVHRLVQSMGLKSKSKGKAANRTLTISKTGKDGGQSSQREFKFKLANSSQQFIQALLQRFPLTSKERQELQPRAEKAYFSREMNRTTTGRLNNGVSQVPPRRGETDLMAFRESLPITVHGGEILNAINNNPVVLISGETGSGKTTQVPQLILDDCAARNLPCRIFCTQPRRLAALTVAERVAAERGEKIGQTVGYQIRLESKVSPKTLLTFCTNGVLLRTLMGSDSALSTVTHVIVDEVHERDRFSDFLLISLRDLMGRYPHFKVILMSAALNVDLFLSYFNNCPLVSIPGNLFDVEEHFLEDVLKWTKYSNKKMKKYMSNLKKVETQQQQLSEWCSRQYQAAQPGSAHRLDMGSVDSSAELGKERDELEPWLVSQMDELMGDIWLNGNQDAFTQIFHFITSDGVSVDYSHSETTATPLMIASARGFTEIVEELLNLGANINTHASNGWTALDWAKKFNQEDVIELLEVYIAASEEGHLEGSPDVEDVPVPNLSQEDRDLLAVYHACFDDDKVDIDLMSALVLKIHTTQPEGAILIFLPGYDDIVSLRDAIYDDGRFEHTRYILFTLHSAMQSSDQKRVFRPSPAGVRKIILATNIAETSVTINDVVYVVNSGKVKEKTFDALSSAVMLKSCWISKASSKQRKGRAGRCRPGVCYNMFSSIRYQNMAEYQLPEIVRYPLQELCLHAKLLTSPDMSVADFLSRAPQAPGFLVIRNAVQLLKQMDAFDAVEDLTELGHHLTDLPLDPQLGKMLLYSVVLKCLDPILTITCTLAYKDPFLLPSLPSDKRAANAARWRFAADTFSDHMAYLRAFQAWQKARADGWERAFCEKNFLSSATFEMIVGMRTQLLGQLRASGFVRARGGGDIRDLNSNSENWGIVKAALCAGSYPNLLRVDRGRQCLVTQKKDKVHIHPGSVLAQGTSEAKLSTAKSLKQALVNFPADWLIYDEISQRERLAFVKCCTLVSPITIALFGGPAKLPSDTLREAEHAPQSTPSNGEGEYVDPGSDSESEERTDWQKPTLRLDEWVSLKAPPEIMNLAVHLRQKWHALFFRRMRAPSKPWSQIDEAVLRAVVNVVTTEEQQMAIQQPAGIGQRPRPMSAESFQPNYGRTSYDYEENNTYYDSRGNKRTSRKSPATTPKRSPVCFGQSTPEPRGGYRQGGGNSGNPNCGSSQRGSASTTPCASPGPMSHPQSLEFEKLTKQPARFFVMKCRTEKNLETSFAQGMWHTTVQMERKISEALQEGKAVYIIASIRSTQFFNGYGEVISTGNKGKNASSKEGQLNVQWIREGEVPFYMTQYLVNTYGNRKIQQSRDGEEIEPKVAEAFLRIWERFPSGQSQSGQSQNRHPGSGDGPGKSPSSSQPQSAHTGQVGDGRYFNQSMRSGPGEYSPSPSVITSTSSHSGAHHTFSMFTGPDQARSAAGSDAVYSRNTPRFVTPVMSPGGQHNNNNNAQLTILQRGMPNPSQRQQQAKPVPGSYHGSGPGAYHPSQHRGHYGHH